MRAKLAAVMLVWTVALLLDWPGGAFGNATFSPTKAWYGSYDSPPVRPGYADRVRLDLPDLKPASVRLRFTSEDWSQSWVVQAVDVETGRLLADYDGSFQAPRPMELFGLLNSHYVVNIINNVLASGYKLEVWGLPKIALWRPAAGEKVRGDYVIRARCSADLSPDRVIFKTASYVIGQTTNCEAPNPNQKEYTSSVWDTMRSPNGMELVEALFYQGTTLIGRDACRVVVSNPPSHAVSGYVLTSAGGGIAGTLVGGLPHSPVTDGRGYYRDNVPEGWGATVTPSKTGYVFDPPSRVYRKVVAVQANQNYAAMLAPLAISGYVTTAEGSGIAEAVIGGLPGNPTTDGNGYYRASIPNGWNGAALPTKTGYAFSPLSRIYSKLTADQTDQSYTATPTFHTISGNVASAGGEGIAEAVMSGLPNAPATDSSGHYSAAIPDGWSGTVTPSKSGYTFNPPAMTYAGLSSDQPDQNYTATPTSHIVSGYVTTAGGQAIAEVVMSGLPNSPTSDSSGFYSDAVPDGWSGTVTPTRTGYTFSPASRTYNSVSSDQASQGFVGAPSQS